MSDSDGFALVGALWLIVMMTALMTFGLRPAITHRLTSENRIAATRAAWASRGCLALVRARDAQRVTTGGLDSVALGEGVWCRVELMNRDERVDPNVGDSVGLMRVLGDPVAVASLLDWLDADTVARAAGAEADWYRERERVLPRNGRVADPTELALVRGFERFDVWRLDSIFSVGGDGLVSVHRAPAWALRSVSSLPPGAPGALVAIRHDRSGFAGPENLAQVLGMSPSVAELTELRQRLSFDDSRSTYRIRGFAQLGHRIVTATLDAELQRVDGELRVGRLVPR